MKSLKVAVAEDEAMNLRRLVRLLEDCGCTIVASFPNGLEMEEWLRTEPEVDALFLDIQMPGLDGLSLRASLPKHLPVVFVSAFAELAVGAFEVEAVDFLLKPVTTERLVKALDRIRGKLSPPQAHGWMGQVTRYPVIVGSGHLLLDLSKTLYFEVEDQVVWAVTGERFRTKWKSLGEVEAFFPDADLIRIHRHLLIRPEAVLGIRSAGGGTRAIVRLTGGIELEASRGATPELKERLGLI
jgi:DNA-binding LytR/AlgR family response regulator